MAPACPKPTYKKRETKRKAPKELIPLEETEQKTVIDWLKWHNILFSATVPDRRYCNRMGYVPGVPDLMIYDKPPKVIEGFQFVGCAIELKRVKGGIVSPEQTEWLEKLTESGWACRVCYGADEAIKFLEYLEYGK